MITEAHTSKAAGHFGVRKTKGKSGDPFMRVGLQALTLSFKIMELRDRVGFNLISF